jgi:hypothetical protein
MIAKTFAPFSGVKPFMIMGTAWEEARQKRALQVRAEYLIEMRPST